MIRVFPRRTKWTPIDTLAFIGDPPLFRPPDQPVMVSCTFTEDLREAERLYRGWSNYYSDVQIGGPALDDAGDDFVPGMFLAKGMVITSRGCPKACDWCMVPHREGGLRELTIKPGTNIVDNNFLACSEKHVSEVFDMLRKQNRAATFSGGLDASIFNETHAELIRSIRLKEAWFAADTPGSLPNLEKAASLLPEYTGRKLRAYVLIGFNGESLRSAERRLKSVYNLGFWPFAMLYQPSVPKKYDREWYQLRKTWTRPAAFKAEMEDKK